MSEGRTPFAAAPLKGRRWPSKRWPTGSPPCSPRSSRFPTTTAKIAALSVLHGTSPYPLPCHAARNPMDLCLLGSAVMVAVTVGVLRTFMGGAHA